MLVQEHRLLAISTPLGEEELVLKSADVLEEIGRPFSIQTELLSENENIQVEDLLGQNVTVRLETMSTEPRYFNGYITEFHQLSHNDKYSRYSATIKPWLWLLTLSENCRIFQDKSYPDIIKQIFNELGFTDFEDKLINTYPIESYTVQFNESDFNFVTRLMEQQGIYYYFSHENGKHTLVLVDDNSTLPDCGEIAFYPPEEINNQFNTEAISKWESQRKLKSGGVRLSDFDFEKPSKNLEIASSTPTTPAVASLERFNYPGKYKERENGNTYTRLLMEMENTDYVTKLAKSSVRTLFAGTIFSLTEHHREDQNSDYIIIQQSHHLRSDEYLSSSSLDLNELYSSTFKAVPAQTIFRSKPSAIKPKMLGPQTAIVVGKPGEEIWTDKYGRVKVLFHWDRYAAADENSSCWIRVAQTWAGKNWGHIQIPRIGQEVLVDFLNGDPDQPIIVGSVFNGSTMPPYSLPENATRSGLKTRSTKGGGGFNEIRVEDKKNEEQIFIHAEKNLDTRIKNNRFDWVGNEQHTKILNNRFETIKENEHKVVGGDALINITGDAHKINEANLNQQTGADENYTIGGDRNQEIGSSDSVKASMDIKHEAGMNYGIKAGMNVDVKGGMNINLQAGATINLKAGPSFISIGPSGVAISGPMIMINSGGGAAPATPGAPSKPATPDKAEEALDADNATPPGKADLPKARKANQEKVKIEPVKATKYSPAAKAMQQAAKTGAPFCEQCDKK